VKPRVRSAIRSIFFEDIGLKLISLITSITLFSVVHGAEDAQKSIYVDVISTLPDAASGKMLVSDIPVRVRVTLAGSPAQLNAIRPDDVPPLELDLRDTRRISYEIDPGDLDVPVGVTVQSVEPSTIALDWVERRERRVRVRPLLVGEPRRGYMVAGAVRVEPEVVELVGPRREVDSLEYVETAEVDLGSLLEGRSERRVRLVHLPEHVIVSGDAGATITIEVVPERAERTIQRVQIGAVGATARSIRPSVVSVTLFGPPDLVQGLDADSVLPYVDASALRLSRVPQMISVEVGGLPSGVEVRRVSPPQVLVTPGG